MDRLHVATVNILNIADRWPARLPLLLADMAALQPDVLGLQEVVHSVEQDRVIGAAGPVRYALHRGWAGRPEYGNSLLVRDDLPTEAEDRVDLGAQRAGNRAIVTLPGGSRVLAAVTHLHHLVADAAIRDRQTAALLEWLDGAPETHAQVVVGDFNARPIEPTYARMLAAGFRSAYSEANGREPDVTWPSPLEKSMPDDDGVEGCLDYIWVRGLVRVVDCRIVFDRPSADDPTLYPSDHLGLSAHLEIGA